MRKNSDIVREVAEHFLSKTIHELDSMYNPELIKDYDLPEGEMAVQVENAEKWWPEVKQITDELFATYNKMDQLIEKMKGN